MGFSESWSVLLLIIAATLVPRSLAATTYIVGGSILWVIPESPDAYSTWAAGETFAVGDTLIFNFTTGAHDVVEVSSSEFEACTDDSPIVPEINEGPATVTLKTAGMHYYICTVGTHCSRGQKVAIKVGSGTTTPTTPTIPTTPSATTSPPSSSAAPLAGVAVVFVSILSYFLYI